MNSPDTFAKLSQAMALYESNDAEGARRIARAVLNLEPHNVDAMHLMGMFDLQLGRPLDAIQWASRALTAAPASHFALNIRAAAYLALQRLDESLADSEAALRLQPGFAEARLNRGFALLDLRRLDEAIQELTVGIAARPQNIDGLVCRSIAFRLSGHLDKARQDADAAVRLGPGHAGAWYALGAVLHDALMFAEADECYARALSINPVHRHSAHNRIRIAFSLNRFPEVVSQYERFRGLGLHLTSEDVFHQVLHARMQMCDWTHLDKHIADLKAHIAAGFEFHVSFNALGLFEDPALILEAARLIPIPKVEAEPCPLPPAIAKRPVKVAYVSSDYREHPTARLLVELIETHDRAQCIPVGVALIGDDGSGEARRMRAAFDQVIDVRDKPDAEIAAAIRALNVDVALDLMGHTGNARLGVYGRRTAPVQATYLGFPGPTGWSCMDYVIADPVVIPAGEESAFSEKVCRLPDTYHPPCSDIPAALSPSRADCNLPEQGIVYASFCNSWKILPKRFDLWMELLRETPNSVLWLLSNGAEMESNLRRRAEASGVGPERIVFAGRATHPVHMARHVLADVMLDTHPYGAHTTASDCLRMGVPIVTLRGTTFPSRVASSILLACGLPELVAETPEAYKAIALKLAKDSGHRNDVRAAIVERRQTAPLFDTIRYTRHMERALRTMVERAAQGHPPENFSVPAIDA